MQRKPPRVYIQDGYFYVSYWLPGVGEKPKSTGIKADIEFEKGNPTWWHASEYKDDLQNKVDIAAANRTALINGQPAISDVIYDQVPSLNTLLDMKAEAYKDRKDRALEKSTIYTYRRAIRALYECKKHVTILTVTVDDAKKFKRWLEAKKYEDETRHLFIRQLRSIWKFAIEKGFIIPRSGIPPNPWKEIFIEVESKLKEPADIVTEKKFFTAAYRLNRKLFDFTFFQRITGYSFADILPITPDMRKTDFWHMRRTKTKHAHYFPDSMVMRYHVDLLPHYDPMFGYRNVQTVNDDARVVCDLLQISKLTTSSFKDSYGDELDMIVEEDRILARLMHHKVKSDARMSSDRYLLHLKKMRQYLNAPDLAHWLEFRRNLENDYEGECRRQGIEIRVLSL